MTVSVAQAPTAGPATEVEEADEDSATETSEGDESGSEGDEVEPVVFKSKDDFVKSVNNIVKTRLDRVEKKYAPVVAERDTLKEKVAELTSKHEGAKSESDMIASMQKQLDELTTYRSTTQRNELVREVAKEKGLPDEFIARVSGDDRDSIEEDVEQLVGLLNVKPASPPKKTTTKPPSNEGKGGKGSGGAGGDTDDAKDDPAAIAKSVGRYGQRPFFTN